jgi:flagellum-specific ATP synthase
MIDLSSYQTALTNIKLIQPQGVVTRAIGLAVEARGIDASIGDFCLIIPRDGTQPVLVEVVGFRDDTLLLMPFSELQGIRAGTRVEHTYAHYSVPTGMGLLGRVIDALGNPIDDGGPLQQVEFTLTRPSPPSALERPPITDIFMTGVRAIDGFLTCGVGQRMGIFSGSGVGKSTLLGMIARGAVADINIIGLVGERGREVKDFITRSLGTEGMRRSVVVVATSDQPALMRLKGAWMATSIAETFRDKGYKVLLLLDSLTRVAMAQREIGLAVGEPPALRGYTPSVFSLLPRLLERSGNSESGSITAFYTVLVEGDDLNEPVTDTVRGVLDGHLILSRALAAENHYPAIDISRSISRTMIDVTTNSHMYAANYLRDCLATYERHQDMIAIGAYIPGTNPMIDSALALLPLIQSFRRQHMLEIVPFEQSIDAMQRLVPSGGGN